MTMAGPPSLFEVGHRAMSAQLVRMNTAASNLANAGSVAGSEEAAYRPMRTVFAQELDRASGLSSVRVDGVVREDVAPIRRHDPGHPLADENGDVWEAPVDENAEMVEMVEASRQYRNMVEALSTAKQLMLETMRMK
jgi:flagellar basal-body rod protein FlgC